MSQSRTYSTLQFLRKLKKKQNKYELYDDHITLLQHEAGTSGFPTDILKLLIEIITKTNLAVRKRVTLLKCLVPEQCVSEEIIKDFIEWFIYNFKKVPSSLLAQFFLWLIGIVEYDLVNKSHISIYYNTFFLMLTQKQIPNLPRLLYILTKPENVTRREAKRIIKLQMEYPESSKYFKKLNALLLLYKTYKPDNVPENIKAINFRNIWNDLPETLHERFEAAKRRFDKDIHQEHINYFEMNTEVKAFGKKASESLIPLISYSHYDKKRRENIDTVSIMDLTSVDELGKHFSKIDFPSQAVSLLNNLAGYHLLCFTDRSYQNRFMYNLYNTLRKAFFIQDFKFPEEEQKKILKKTTLFCRYMQEGIPAVNYFLHEYLLQLNGDNSQELLDLLTWSFDTPEVLRDSMFRCIKMLFVESSVEEKQRIIRMFSNLIYNLYINQCYVYEVRLENTLFLKSKRNDNPISSIVTITQTVENLAIVGLLTHAFDSMLLSEILNFYETVAILQERSNCGVCTIAPPTVIYGAFTSGSGLLLSRLCDLLKRYDLTVQFLSKKGLKETFKTEINLINFYIYDLTDILIKNKAFSFKDKRRLFLKHFPKKIIEELDGHPFDNLLNVAYHFAFLPQVICCFFYNKYERFNIDTGMIIADQYFPGVSNFIRYVKNREIISE